MVRKRFVSAFQMIHAKYASTLLHRLHQSDLDQDNSFAISNNTTVQHPFHSFNAQMEQSMISKIDPKENNLVIKKSSSMENSMINNFYRFEISNSQKMILNVLELGKDNLLEEEYIKKLGYVSDNEEEENNERVDEGRRAPRGTLLANRGDSGMEGDFLTMKFHNTQEEISFFQSNDKNGILKDNTQKNSRRFSEFGEAGPTKVYKDKRDQVITETLRNSLNMINGKQGDSTTVEGTGGKGNKRFFSELAKNAKLRDMTIKKMKEKQKEDMLDSVIKKKNLKAGKKFGNFYTPLPKKDNNFGNADFIEEEDESFETVSFNGKTEKETINNSGITEEEDYDGSLHEDEIEDDSLAGFSESLEDDDDIDLISSKSQSNMNSESDSIREIKRKSNVRRVSIIDTEQKNAEIQERRNELETIKKKQIIFKHSQTKTKIKPRNNRYRNYELGEFKSEKLLKGSSRTLKQKRKRKISNSLQLKNMDFDFTNYEVEELKTSKESKKTLNHSKATLNENYSFTAEGFTDHSTQVHHYNNTQTNQSNPQDTKTKQKNKPFDYSNDNDSFDDYEDTEFKQIKEQMINLKESTKEFSLANNEVSFQSYDKSVDFSDKLNQFYNNTINDNSIDFLKQATTERTNPNSESIDTFKHNKRISQSRNSEMDDSRHFTFANKSVDMSLNNISLNNMSFGQGKHTFVFDSNKPDLNNNVKILNAHNNLNNDEFKMKFAKKTSKPNFEIILETEIQESGDSKISPTKKDKEFKLLDSSLNSPKKIKMKRGKGISSFGRKSLADSINSLKESVKIENVFCKMKKFFESNTNKQKQIVLLFLHLNNYNARDNKITTTFSILNKTKNVKLRNAFDCIYKFCVNDAKFQIIIQKMSQKYSKNIFIENLKTIKDFKDKENKKEKKRLQRRSIQKVELKLFVATFQHIKRNKLFDAFNKINMWKKRILEETELFRNSNINQVASNVITNKLSNKKRFKRRSTLNNKNVDQITCNFKSAKRNLIYSKNNFKEEESKISEDSLAEEADLFVIEVQSKDSNLKDLKRPSSYINSPCKSGNLISFSNVSDVQSNSLNYLNSPFNLQNKVSGEVLGYGISKNSVFSYKDSVSSGKKSNQELSEAIKKLSRLLEISTNNNKTGLLKRLNNVIEIVMAHQSQLTDKELYSLKIALKQLIEGFNVKRSQTKDVGSKIKEKSLLLSGLLRKVESNSITRKDSNRVGRNKRGSLLSHKNKTAFPLTCLEAQDLSVFINTFLKRKRNENTKKAFKILFNLKRREQRNKFIELSKALLKKKEIEERISFVKEAGLHKKNVLLKKTAINMLLRRYRVKLLKAIRNLSINSKKLNESEFNGESKETESFISLSKESDYMSVNTIDQPKKVIIKHTFTLYKNRESQRETISFRSTASNNRLTN